MNSFDWVRFFEQWSQAILESMGDQEKEQLPSKVLASGWLGYPGATEGQIARAEARLGVKLPPSYRDFLKVTNGWRQTAKQTASFRHRLWSTEDIERFAVRHPQWIKAFTERHESAEIGLDDSHELDDQWEPVGISDDDYFVYGESQDPSKLRPEYLKTVLEISDVGIDSIYLLNPQVVTPDGEWEAWFFADYLPGADRYRSFREMMEAEYRNFLEFRASEAEVSESVTTRGVSATSEAAKVDEPDVSLAFEPVGSPNTGMSTPSELTIDTELITWQPLKRLTVEFQCRQVDDQAEYRTLVSSDAVSQPQAWPGLIEDKLQLWLQEHLTTEVKNVYIHEPSIAPDLATAANVATKPASIQSSSARTFSDDIAPSPVPQIEGAQRQEPPLEINLEIAQLAIRQPANSDAQIVVRPAMARQAKRIGISPLSSRQPFSVEVAFHLAGQRTEAIAPQEIFYQARVFAQNRTTHQWAELGETPPNTLEKARSTYTATLWDRTLEPGMYRLQVLTSLSGAAIALSSFELPLLNVV